MTVRTLWDENECSWECHSETPAGVLDGVGGGMLFAIA